jgi:hypothetical protein
MGCIPMARRFGSHPAGIVVPTYTRRSRRNTRARSVRRVLLPGSTPLPEQYNHHPETSDRAPTPPPPPACQPWTSSNKGDRVCAPRPCLLSFDLREPDLSHHGSLGVQTDIQVRHTYWFGARGLSPSSLRQPAMNHAFGFLSEVVLTEVAFVPK